MPAYSLLEEAWSDPIMKQTENGNFIINENLNDEYDEKEIKSNMPSNYSKLINSSGSNLNSRNSMQQNDPNAYLLIKKNKQRRHRLKPSIIEDFSNSNYKINDDEETDDEEENDNLNTIKELKNHVKSLESQIKKLKERKTISNFTNYGSQGSFNNINTNELIVFGGIGILTIMLVDSFTKLGMKLNALKQ